jgi:hypothetical protein
MTSSLEQAQADLSITGYGQKGGILLTDTTEITGAFRMLIVLEDAVFTTLTTEYTNNDDTTLATGSDWGTLYTGFVFSGKITSCKLASGKVLLVK